ncbi:hypothetical protein A3762_10430 [Oleiphilus sp. HI0125]|uniref:hypothetical protein n=1 Tax=Oleiphilus sp. HI0125 TaxID=1822266 RepID=UPI0007C25C30|nr:hypothetical protein [Oleiphilus sp. HI0125]KZZ57125.1 hypothetical protein A3762_10430 [Oleiphilus sp. HI0125]
MFSIEKKNQATWLHCKINEQDEIIKFAPYTLKSERSEYQIEQEYGLNEHAELSKDFVDFEPGSTEEILLSFVKTGDPSLLEKAELILCDRPKKNNISRNLAIFDPKSGQLYFIGGLGLIRPTEDHTTFVLKDPLLGEFYGEYQEERGNPAGGTQYFSDEGIKGSINRSIVGTLEYNTGLYHAERKALENEKLKEKGLNCPSFIAAGKILNYENGKFGFTIYRSNLTPDYMLNLGIYVNEQGQLKKNYLDYLASKYSQLYTLHSDIGESHGQTSLTNTLGEIDINQTNNNIRCQIKDFETNHPLPTNTDLIIEEGISPIPCGWYTKKSPAAGAQLYDLQHALLQELNVIALTLSSIQHPQQKFNYLAHQCATILLHASTQYAICSEEKSREAIQFAIDTFIEILKKTQSFSHYNEVISGVFAHKLFSLSDAFSEQVKIYAEEKEPEVVA